MVVLFTRPSLCPKVLDLIRRHLISFPPFNFTARQIRTLCYRARRYRCRHYDRILSIFTSHRRGVFPACSDSVIWRIDSRRPAVVVGKAAYLHLLMFTLDLPRFKVR